MNKIVNTVALILLPFIPAVGASDYYRGGYQGQLVEPNGDVYVFSFGGEKFNGENLSYLRQERGQRVVLSAKRFGEDNARDGKYFVKVTVSRLADDRFTAKIRLFQNHVAAGGKPQGIVRAKEIRTVSLEGELYSKNDYQLVDHGFANLYLSFDIDRIFSQQESLKRHLKKTHLNNIQSNAGD